MTVNILCKACKGTGLAFYQDPDAPAGVGVTRDCEDCDANGYTGRAKVFHAVPPCVVHAGLTIASPNVGVKGSCHDCAMNAGWYWHELNEHGRCKVGGQREGPFESRAKALEDAQRGHWD